MGESSKQVRVDNWGTFFLQRLQLFFNKTDYCDLTLQFEGNEQLKVHRLVMNACTEYFQMLEQAYDTVDNVLIMPPDMQADVVVPIVNFMYTGMLEFQISKFEKLYKTAELMNITVLTKLLDAQKQPILPTRQTNKRSTHTSHSLDSPVKKSVSKTSNSAYLPPTLPGRKLPVWKRRVAPTPSSHPVSTQFYSDYKRPTHHPDPLAVYDNTPKPTRFEWPDEDLTTFNLLDSSSNFDDISYTSRPLLTQEDEMRTGTSFDDIKYSVNINKPASKNYGGAAVDMEDVKNYMKEQKIRSHMTDYDDEEAADNDFETYVSTGQKDVNTSRNKRKLDNDVLSPTKRVRFSVNEKENKETKINVTPMGKSATEMNHTKIISELLKKYPHLVKKNKNIRLKIMAKSNKLSPSEPVKVSKASTSKLKVQVTQGRPSKSRSSKTNVLDENDKKDGPWTCHRCSTQNDPVEFVLYYLYRKHMTDVHSEKFDSRMCKYCGHKSNKHNMLTYHLYTKHGVKPPPAYNFPKCSQCHYIALTEALLIKHKLNHTKFELQCPECKVAFNSQNSLENHMEATGHTGKFGKTNYNCQYCTKRYHTGANLFSHIKMQHREEARRDGIVSIDEIEDTDGTEDSTEEQQVREEDKYITPEIIHERTKEKVKVLSDVKVSLIHQPQQQTIEQEVILEPSSEAEALSNVASGIATSLGLVDIVVLDDNQQYILHSNDQQLAPQQELQGNQQEYILPDLTSTHTYSEGQEVIEHNDIEEHNVITQTMLNNSDIASTDELVMVLTDHDYGDGNNELLNNENSNIVVLYSHPVDGQENQFITSQSNLLVNSQTGMIEIRNGAAITTTAPDHVVVTRAEDTQIESIEMIQQEINSHSSATKQEVDFEEHNAVAEGSTQNATGNLEEEEPMQQDRIESNQQQAENIADEQTDFQDKPDNNEQGNLDTALVPNLGSEKEVLEQTSHNEVTSDVLEEEIKGDVQDNSEAADDSQVSNFFTLFCFQSCECKYYKPHSGSVFGPIQPVNQNLSHSN